jgi:radical SAM protein with 4Fe4S-binding SPASM domain
MYNFIPTGRGKFISNNDLTSNQREKLLNLLYSKLKDKTCNVNVLSTAPQFTRVALQNEMNNQNKIIPTHFYNPELSDKLVNLAEFIGGCGCGRFYCAIRPNGNIDPCVFFPLTIGNILKDDFESLWRNNKTLIELRNRDHLKDACMNCQFNYYCGGCRARAYAYKGDYLAGDIGCINNDKYGTSISLKE